MRGLGPFPFLTNEKHELPASVSPEPTNRSGNALEVSQRICGHGSPPVMNLRVAGPQEHTLH
jgi:hypothetical protein